MKNEKAKVKIIPLGGVNEIGKNLTAIEYKNDIVVIDCGLKFPDEDMFGIDLVIPDISSGLCTLFNVGKINEGEFFIVHAYSKFQPNLSS